MAHLEKLNGKKSVTINVGAKACGVFATDICGADTAGCGWWSKDCCSQTDAGECGAFSYDCTDADGHA